MALKSFKTQIDPTKDQIERFEKWSKVRVSVWNWALSVRKWAYDEMGMNYGYNRLRSMATDKKKRSGFEWWSDPPYRVIHYALDDLERAYEGFFGPIGNGPNTGFPKRKYVGDDVRFSVYGGAECKVYDDRVKLSCMSEPVSLVEEGYIPTDADKFSRVTVRERAGKWMISVQCHVDIPVDPDRLRPEDERPHTMAFHPGVRVWVARQTDEQSIDTESLPMDRMWQLMNRIDRLHRGLQRKEPGSNNWQTNVEDLQRNYKTLADLREDYTHKATSRVCYAIRPRVLVIQDWDMSHLMERGLEDLPNMVQARIKRRMANANIGELKSQLKYKSEWADVRIQVIPEDVHVSERCAQCGHMHGDLGGNPVYDCPSCQQEVDREVNAIQNYWIEHEAGRTVPLDEYEAERKQPAP